MHISQEKDNQEYWNDLARNIVDWGKSMGFSAVGISHTDLGKDEAKLIEWLSQGMHGEMHYMEAHGYKRSRPAELVPGTISIISVRINYLSSSARSPTAVLRDPNKAYIARYALGKDYHKLIRKRLQKFADRINQEVNDLVCRPFCDSAPVMERPIAIQAGIGWQGKNTNLIDCNAGSWFFLGEIYTNLPLPSSQPQTKHYCGSCTRCMQVCPTNAIIDPWKIDATKCISYLTIELKGSIPVELRPLIGNRVYGCDDCQIFCPWNRRPHYSREQAFNPRNNIDDIDLVEIFSWSKWQFERYFLGSPIRRLGYQRWLRNIAVALGNAPYSKSNVKVLMKRCCDSSALVAEHARWGLNQQLAKRRSVHCQN